MEKFTGVHETINIKSKLMNKNITGLQIVSTPIGNLNDISQRAVETIKNCDLVVCENPNHSLKLLNKLGIKKKLIALHDHNEKNIINKLSKDLKIKSIVLISDAGSPLISDPGFKLVQFCIKNKIDITTVPGANAIIPALQLSGIPINEFYFAGFFPKTKNQIDSFFNNVESVNKTTVFFVSSHKVKLCTEYLGKKFKDRQISICKELTKLNEKVFRGLGSEILQKLITENSNFKGEFVFIISAKASKKPEVFDLKDYKTEIKKLLTKFSLTDVVEIVHKLTGITKNKIYKCALELKRE